MNKQFYHLKLEELYTKAKEIEIHDNQRFVIFSDLHVGNGKYGDDFRPNAKLFQTALHDYYYEKGYTLILNGDIEELHRYTLAEIRSTWKSLYSLFDAFDAENRLYKLSGNHDSKLFNLPGEPLRYKLYESLKLNYKGMTLFLFHGHQPSYFYEKFNEISGLLLRFIAKPLRIKHYSVAHDKGRRFKIEKRTYEFSIEKTSYPSSAIPIAPFLNPFQNSTLLNTKSKIFCADMQNPVTKNKSFLKSKSRKSKKRSTNPS